MELGLFRLCLRREDWRKLPRGFGQRKIQGRCEGETTTCLNSVTCQFYVDCSRCILKSVDQIEILYLNRLDQLVSLIIFPKVW